MAFSPNTTLDLQMHNAFFFINEKIICELTIATILWHLNDVAPKWFEHSSHT